MKYSVKGSVNFGSNGQVHMTDRVKNFLSKVFGGKEVEESPKNGISGTFGISGSTEYELSAELSSEELVELFKLSKDNDLHVWELMKAMGKDTLKAIVEVRKVASEEIPAWQDIVHNAEMKDLEHSEIEDEKSSELADRRIARAKKNYSKEENVE